MPFGLANEPRTFQHALDIILTRYKCKPCLVYMEDIIMFSKDIEEHLHHVNEIITTLGEAGVTRNLGKCHIFSDSVDYLSYIIKPGQLEIDQSHTKSLRDAKPPTN